MAIRNRILKDKIIDTAQALFSDKGYEKTSVNDIINYLGVSKGAFYHYFHSKEELLDTIIMEYVDEVVNMMYKITDQPHMNALEKYRKMFLETQARRKENLDRLTFLVRMSLSEDNLLFRHRYTERILELTKPPFVLILNQGVREGLFRINNPEETAELIMRIGNIYRTKIAIQLMSPADNSYQKLKIQNMIEFLQDSIERILGLDPGSLGFISEGFAARR